MSLIRIRGLELLANKLGCAVPALSGNVCAGPAQHPDRLAYPSAAVVAARSEFFPDQATQHACPTPSTAVFCVGRVETIVQVILWSSNDSERYALEDAVLSSVFYSDTERPGVCRIQIPDCSNALVTWDLDSFMWEDERGYSNKWGSVLTSTMQMPALVKVSGVYTIDEIQAQFTEDLDTDVASIDPGDVETAVITA